MSATSRGVLLTILVSIGVFFHHAHNVDGIAVMSVDIGLEWMKVAIVSVSIENFEKSIFKKYIFRTFKINNTSLVIN